MDYTTLGRTGLKVSVAGLGGGGASRLGKAYGKSFEHSVSIVREAMDLGVNFHKQKKHGISTWSISTP